MSIVSKKFLTWLLIVTATLVPMSARAQKAKTMAVRERTFVGYISDGSCGLKHMQGMNEKDCTLMCAENGKFVLADRDHKLVYELDKIGQKKAREFAGQKVRVKGQIVRKTIRVTAIESVG